MLRKMLGYLALPLLLLLSNSSGNSAPQLAEKSADAQTGTLEKMIVAQGSVAMDLDLPRLNGTASGTKEAKPETLRFQVGPNSFFTILVFNDAFRDSEAGSMGLIPENTVALPGTLQTALNQLVIEKLSSDARFDLAVRDGKTGFVFFNIEGNLYEYDAAAHLLSIKEGRLLMSEEFANKLGRSADAGALAGRISISATMYPIEITTVVNGAVQSSVLPARGGRSSGAGARCHRGRSAFHGAIWKQRDAGRPGGGNDLVQRRRCPAELVCVIQHGPSGHSAKSLSHERRRD